MNFSENIKSNAPDETIWLRLRRLRSVNLSKNIIRSKYEKKNIPIEKDILNRKANGLSSAIDSALGYLDIHSYHMNSKILTRYYGLLHLTIAEQVASVKNNNDISKIQEYTKYGHGLKSIIENVDVFPKEFFIYSLLSGYFNNYLNYLGIDIKAFSYKIPIQKIESKDKDKLIPIIDIFRRIPELYPIVYEHVSEKPLCLIIEPVNTINLRSPDDFKNLYKEATGKMLDKITNFDDISFLYIYCEGVDINLEDINSTGLPFLQCDKGKSDKFFFAAMEKNKIEHLNHYQSRHTILNTYICPVHKCIQDPIAINFMLLYGLSIIVRYYPQFWYEISSGELNQYYSLIEYYLSVFDHVIPEKMLERITGKSLRIYL